MENLSYAQEYYLCAVNSKGDVPAMKSVEIHGSLLAGAVAQLLERGFVERGEGDALACAKPLDDSFSYLRPPYDAIASQKKPRNLKSFVTWEFKPRLYNGTLFAIGASLAALGHADELSPQGFLKRKTKFAPKPEATATAIGKIRSELLESDSGGITGETLCLTALLDKSKLLKDFFSKDELDALKKRLEEARGSEAYDMAKDVIDVISAGAAVAG